MRKRLIIAAVCILALPLLFSPSHRGKLMTSTPFATIALAGHSHVGGVWCECGAPACICDPREQPNTNLVAAPPGAYSEKKDINQASAPDIDLASGMLTLALGVLFWLRMR